MTQQQIVDYKKQYLAIQKEIENKIPILKELGLIDHVTEYREHSIDSEGNLQIMLYDRGCCGEPDDYYNVELDWLDWRILTDFDNYIKEIKQLRHLNL